MVAVSSSTPVAGDACPASPEQRTRGEPQVAFLGANALHLVTASCLMASNVLVLRLGRFGMALTGCSDMGRSMFISQHVSIGRQKMIGRGRGLV